MSDTDLKKKASDPATPAVELQQLATNPELRPLIAKNPAAYTGLLDWMAAKNEPPVTAALREREAMFQGGIAMDMPSVSLHEAPSADTANTPVEPLKSKDSASTVAPEADSPRDANPDSPATPAASGGTPEETSVSEAAPHEAAPSNAPGGSPPPAAPQRTSILGGYAQSNAVPSSEATTVLPPANVPDNSDTSVPGAATLAAAAHPTPPIDTGAGGSSAEASGTSFYTAPGATDFPGTPNTSVPSYPGSYAPTAVTGSLPVMVAPGTPQPTKSNTVLWVIFSLLLAAVVGLSVALVWIYLGANNDGAPAEAQTAASKVETGSETNPKAGNGSDKTTENPEDSTNSTEKPVQAPAPSDALKDSAMTTKSGNTSCAVSGQTLSCAVKDHEATIGSCGPNTSAVVTLGDDAPTVTCAPKESYSTQGTVPNYGQSVDMGEFACTSLYDYTECWNIHTGTGFQIARQLYNVIQID